MEGYKTLWEKENGWLPAFSPFPTIFSNASFRATKTRDRVQSSPDNPNFQ